MKCQTFLTPHENPYPPWGVDGESGWLKVGEAGGGEGGGTEIGM